MFFWWGLGKDSLHFCVSPSSTRPIVVAVNQARDEVRRDANDQSVGDDGHYANRLQDIAPHTLVDMEKKCDLTVECRTLCTCRYITSPKLFVFFTFKNRHKNYEITYGLCTDQKLI